MILGRMLAVHHGRTVLVTLAVLLTLALVSEVFESARHVLTKDATAWEIVLYYLCRLPPLAHLLLPISLVAGTFVAFARLGRNLELRALAAAGVGPVRMLVPAGLVALVVVAATVLVGEWLVPPALDRAEELMRDRFGRIDSSWRFFRRTIWFRGEGERLFRVAATSADGENLRGVTLLEMDPAFHPRRRVDLHRVAWRDGRWQARGVRWWTFSDGRMTSNGYERRRTLAWPEQPDRFRDLRGRPKQKTAAELVRTIEDMRRRGLGAVEYRLELHNRFAFPGLGMVLVLAVFPWLCAPQRRRTLAGALIEATVVLFCAYFVVGMITAAVSGGALGAGWGAWTPVLLASAAAAGVWLRTLRRAKRGAA